MTPKQMMPFLKGATEKSSTLLTSAPSQWGESFKAAFELAEAERKAAEAKALVGVMVELQTSSSATLDAVRHALRVSRAAAKSYSRQIRDINRAIAYFQETANPVPLFAQLDPLSLRQALKESGDARADISNLGVPDSWVPTSPAGKAMMVDGVNEETE